MNRKIITTMVSIVAMFVIIMNISVFADEPSQIVVSNMTAEPGMDNVIIEISLKNNPGIVSAKMTIDFDTDALTLTNVSDKGVLGNVFHSPTLQSPYNLYWNNGSATENITANGTIATLTFTVNEYAKPGVYPIFLSYDEDNILNSDMDNVFFNTTDGSITVKKADDSNPTISVGGISFDITLKADSYTGNIIAALYSSNNVLKSLKTYTASENLRVSFDQGQTGAYVKIMWWDDINSMKPLCPAEIVDLS